MNKEKNEKRPKKLLRQRQEDDTHITIIKDGRIIVQDGKPVKK